ncbi:hypothetical protein A2858_03480 [Candidatus Daviesbacteria bacterium RIFCSPHIGHO2_01_FULL_36_37]|uniref:Glycosyltransferase RgtA/B/C/D-like domain-containing protein n=3 Tax=Candidatus Daviesiibacteriota TaxID=1752718 RepID=A0A0G0I0B9_9BACT|nr:MAG: hypothetical protein US19_C0012G0010 [Candidatus Daviesbacteria bacterium GW2011_GWB1_36_5]KKQ16447.1 MAG: hypothetical protein US28_C0001G0037 [Candidatus Daviesbacteria bacterium GW2011_GWA1_36_8]OGE17779.1 MAG: hypothetical protein A2858_03480 [Candidatus Daviesbacteria bacterium RIFCSPHIGHO2_01_FULL_36_37]
MKVLTDFRYSILILLGIIILYFGLRLPNLTLQPIFADEAIYVRWAQVMRSEPTLRFLPQSDGKTPLYMWVLMPMFKIFEDPLFAGRILSVLSGFTSLLGAFVLGWRFFNLKVGLWGAFLVAITPYMVFFDRMALVDSMLAAFTIWSLILALQLIKTPRLDLAMILGYLLGGGMLTKPPGFFNILILPTTLLNFNFSPNHRVKRILKQFGLMIIAILIALVIYNILRLGPEFNNLSSRNQDYVHSPERIFEYPLDPLIPHFHDILDWFPKFFTIPILLFSIAGIVYGSIKKNKTVWVISLWAILPLFAQMYVLKTFTARYLLFSIPPLLVLGAFYLEYLSQRFSVKKEIISLVLVLILLPQALNFDIRLLTDPASAPLPKTERTGYFEGWTAGYGFVEIAQFLKSEAAKGPIVVGTEGAFGTLPDGLYIYLDKVPNISIVTGGPKVSDELRDSAKKHPTYFVANKSRYFQPEEGLELIKEFPKAKGSIEQDSILFYQLKQKTSDVNPRMNALNNTALAVKLRRNHGREPVELHKLLPLK